MNLAVSGTSLGSQVVQRVDGCAVDLDVRLGIEHEPLGSAVAVRLRPTDNWAEEPMNA